MSRLRYWAGSWLMGAGVVVLVASMFAAAQMWFTDIDPAVMSVVVPATGSVAGLWALDRRRRQHNEELERKKAEAQHPAGTMSGRGGRLISPTGPSE